MAALDCAAARAVCRGSCPILAGERIPVLQSVGQAKTAGTDEPSVVSPGKGLPRKSDSLKQLGFALGQFVPSADVAREMYSVSLAI